MNAFDIRKRPEYVKEVQNTSYDLIIIGGGITGAGIALDACTRGFKTLLLEKRDFASGTSSKSTKLIHGGLRYLKQFEIALVRETGMERAVVHKLAPHLVKPEKMLLPLIKDGTYGKMLTSIGLMVYDVLAGVEKPDQRKMLDKKKVMTEEPLLKEEIVEGGGMYAEYRTDDARLTLEILKTAASHGAHVLNYSEVLDFLYENDRIVGIKWQDKISDQPYELKSQFVVNATGPWVDKVRSKDHEVTGKHLHPTKGIHIVVARERLPVRHAVYFDEPEGRMLFAIPRDRSTYIGTTDTNYDGDLDKLPVSMDDVNYLLRGANHIFPKANLSVEDVESTWVGLRPLIEDQAKSASEISRKDEIFESDTGLFSIAGGKLTGYRKMAERIVDRIARKAEKFSIELKASQTKKIVLSGGVFENHKEVMAYTEDIAQRLGSFDLSTWANYLVSNYGRQTDDILDIFNTIDNNDPEVRLGLAELQFCMAHEGVCTLLDFFERRTGRLYFYIKSIDKLKEPALDYMAQELSWDQARKASEREALEHAMYRSSNFEA